MSETWSICHPLRCGPFSGALACASPALQARALEWILTDDVKAQARGAAGAFLVAWVCGLGVVCKLEAPTFGGSLRTPGGQR